MAHDQILVIQLVIRTIIKRSGQKPHHIVLIQIHVAHVALVLIVIDKVDA